MNALDSSIMSGKLEAKERKSSSGYGRPPWIFKGSALYQLHLVKADTVRAIIPKELKIVEAFGYTLGGFFLANYEDSPVGSFDELVVISGIVWNPPTSCAWATRVLVSSQDACSHGRKAVGLPSQVATFSKKIAPIPMHLREGKLSSFFSSVGVAESTSDKNISMDVEVTETTGYSFSDHCNIKITRPIPAMISEKGMMGPEIKMSLPSFSGRTEHNANLLKYSCAIRCRLRPVKPAAISRISPATQTNQEDLFKDEYQSKSLNLSTLVMLSKPIFAVEFNCLTMQVEAPITVSHGSHLSEKS